MKSDQILASTTQLTCHSEKALMTTVSVIANVYKVVM